MHKSEKKAMCFKQRKGPAIAVTIFSGLVVIVGLIMIYLSFKFKGIEVLSLGEDNASETSNNEISDFRNTAFVILFSASLIAVLVGTCGMSLMCIKHRGCAVAFGCALLPVWIILFFFGVIIAVFSNSSQQTIEQFCNNVDMQSDYIDSIRDVVADIDDFLGEAISTKMCSNICPCPSEEGVRDPWEQMEEAQLNSYGRTKREFSTQDYIPLDFSGIG